MVCYLYDFILRPNCQTLYQNFLIKFFFYNAHEKKKEKTFIYYQINFFVNSGDFTTF